MFLGAYSKEHVPRNMFQRTCSKEHVPRNMFQWTCSKEHVPGNMFQGTCSKEQRLWEMQLSFWHGQKVHKFSVFFNKWACIKPVRHHTLHALLWPYLPSHMQSLRLHGLHQLEMFLTRPKRQMLHMKSCRPLRWSEWSWEPTRYLRYALKLIQ